MLLIHRTFCLVVLLFLINTTLFSQTNFTTNVTVTDNIAFPYWSGFKTFATTGKWGFQQNERLFLGVGGNVYNRGFSTNSMGIFNGSATKEDIYLYNQNDAQADFIVLKNNGNVGIGNVSPTEKLSILSGYNSRIKIGSNGDAGFYTGEMGGIIFTKHYDLFQCAKIYTYSNGGISSYNGADIRFATAAQSGGIVDRMTIDMNGRIGIGTTWPSSLFHVEGNLNGWIQQIKGTGTNVGEIIGLKFISGYPGEYGKWTGIASVVESQYGNSNGLAFYTNLTEKVRIDATGRVGIGTTTPNSLLHLDPAGSGQIFIGNPNTGSGSYTSLSMGISSYQNGYGYISVIGSAGGSWGPLELNPFGGNVLIGNRTTGGPTTIVRIGNKQHAIVDGFQHNLQVYGSIYGKVMRIFSDSEWADFVFEKGYEKMSLEETEKYIQQNKHLPNIPTACDIQEKGIDTGEMLRLQMIKIEELTLHVIELNKKIVKLENK